MKGGKLMSKNYRWWSLPILLHFVASIGENFKKRIIPREERSVHTNSESYNIRLGSSKNQNQVNSKQIIQILQPIIIDNFSTHSCKVDIS